MSQTSPRRPIGLRQFRNASSYSYLIWDRNVRQAVIIDPCVELMSDYRSFVAENGFEIVAAVDTQLHPDRLSATHLFRAEYGAQVCMSARTLSQRSDRKLHSSDTLTFGDSTLQIFETPGQAQDGISLLSSRLLLCGHVLPLSGRSPFFPQVDPPSLVRSYEKLFSLAGETLVFPARDSNDLLFSTIANEKERNAAFRMRTIDEFHALLKDQAELPRIRSAADIESCLQFNQSANPATVPLLDSGEFAPREVNSIPSIGAAKLSKKIGKRDPGAILIDVREPSEFQLGHIPGSMNVPVWDLPFRLPELAQFKKIYVASLSGLRGDWRGPAAARTLAYLGLPDITAIEGGFRSWAQLGYSVETG